MTGERDTLRTFFEAVFPAGETGYLHTAVFTGGHFNERGKYDHTGKPELKAWHYPDQLGDAIDWILDARHRGDVYFAPTLMRTGATATDSGRTKANIIGNWQAHADCDNGVDPKKVEKLGGITVLTGSPGHGHAHFPFAEPVTAQQREVLATALRTYFDGDNKVSSNDYLRPPYTRNWKSGAPRHPATERTGAPTETALAEPFTPTRVKPAVLAAELGVDLSNIATTNGSSAGTGEPVHTNGVTAVDTNARDEIDLSLYPSVKEAIDNPVLRSDGTVDRSATTYHVVAVCIEAHLELAHARWAVDRRDDLRAKLAEVSPRDDVAIDWEKIQNQWPRNQTAAAPAGSQPAVRVAKHSGHLGWAVKLAAHEKGRLLFVNGVGWHRWDGKRFARDADGAARRAVHAMLKRDRQTVLNLNLPNTEEEKALNAIARYETTSAITGILTEAAALQEFSVVADDLDADPWLFNCQNGTLDLRTMVLGGHDPSDRISKVANAAYDPNAIGTEWTGFLGKVLPDDEVRAYLQRLTGLSLLGEVNGDKQIAPIAYGAGANGKTTYIETACFAMGDYAMTAEPTLLMSKRGEVHPTGVADLLGKRLVSTTETQQGARFDIALLKRLTGGDTLKARWMRQDFFEFAPSHLLLMCTNHLPEVDDGSEAVWRRIRLIPFTVEIPQAERDEGLKDKLRAEADAVLSWVIGGWADYRTNGLAEPDAVLTATGEYQAESDAVGRFITEECLTGGAQSSATTGVLYQAWEVWQQREGCLPMSMKAFGHELDVKGYPVDQRAYRKPRYRICLKPVSFFKVAGP